MKTYGGYTVGQWQQATQFCNPDEREQLVVALDDASHNAKGKDLTALKRCIKTLEDLQKGVAKNV